VSPTTAKKSRDTVPPVGPTLPVGGAPASIPPLLLPPLLLPLPPHVAGGAWHLLVCVLQYHPP
jgi:hypothetical protein